MDITHVWRTLHADPAALPHVGAHLETAGQESQARSCPSDRKCRMSASSARSRRFCKFLSWLSFEMAGQNNSLSVTGIPQNVAITESEITVRFHPGRAFPCSALMLRSIGWTGAPQSITLDYVSLECNPWVWWWWPSRVLHLLIHPFGRTG